MWRLIKKDIRKEEISEDAAVRFYFMQVGRLHSGHHNERQGFPICGRVEKGARSRRDKRWIQARRSGLSDGTEPGCRNLYDLVSVSDPLFSFALFLHFINRRTDSRIFIRHYRNR